MKVDFTIDCPNPGVVFAIADALKAHGFKVHGCGVMLATGEPDIDCSPPIDFIDKVPAPLQAFVDGSPGPVADPPASEAGWLTRDDPNSGAAQGKAALVAIVMVSLVFGIGSLIEWLRG